MVLERKTCRQTERDIDKFDNHDFFLPGNIELFILGVFYVTSSTVYIIERRMVE